MCDFREMIPKWTLALSILAGLLHGVTMLQLVDLKVPPYTIRGQSVRLECHYDLEGEALYSVKWFKDDKEFFRFYPEDDPPAQLFRVQGVYVDLPNSSDTAVMLKTVDMHGSGNYRCEVSAEAPSFKTVFHEKSMIVVDLPDASGPQIDGVRPRYHIGDTVRVNCTSSRSRPAAKLAWYINQESADESYLRHYPVLQEEDGFETSLLGLEFKVRQKHFKRGDLKIKCLATIDTLYWRTNEQSVEGDRPQKAQVLENRDAFSSEASAGMKLSSTKDTINIMTLSLIINLVIWLRYNDIILNSLGKLCQMRINRETNYNGKAAENTFSYSNSAAHSSPPMEVQRVAAEETVQDERSSHKALQSSSQVGDAIEVVELPSPSSKSQQPILINFLANFQQMLPILIKFGKMGDRKYT